MNLAHVAARALHRGVRDNSGQVGVIFALSILPLMGLVGLGVDFGRASMIKSDLNAAADEAALAVVSASSNPQMVAPTSSDITKYFDAAVDVLPPGVTYTTSSATSTNGMSLTVTVNYKATVPTIFGGMFGVPTATLTGSATAVGQLPSYVNFYLLLDNSPSMGIGATAGDIQNLEDLTPDSCAFACHQHSFDASGKITGDDTSDYYHVAKNNNVTTRIDVLRSATQSLMTTATNAEAVPNQFGMALYAFSDTFQTISNLSTSLSSVQSSAAAIDLAYAYDDQRDAQTSYDTALTYISKIIPNAGSGASSSQPQEFLFLVTDGVQDEPVGSGSGNGDPADQWASKKVKSGGTSVNSQPNLQNSEVGNVNSKRMITALSPSACTAIKNRGVKIAVLYTTYLPVVNNAFYNEWVAPISTTISPQLQSCASPGFFFQISPTQGISAAMTAMFNAAISEARLTK